MRNFQEISNENRKTVKYGIEAISNWHCDKCMCIGYAKIFSKIYGFDKTSGLVNFSETIKKKLKCSFKIYIYIFKCILVYIEAFLLLLLLIIFDDISGKILHQISRFVLVYCK